MKPNNVLIGIGLFILLIVLPLASSEIQSLGVFKVNDNVELKQIGAGFNNCTITSVLYPNSSEALGLSNMDKSGNQYNYTFISSSVLGSYIVNSFCTDSTGDSVWAYDFEVTATGEKFDNSQGLMIIGQLGIVALFLILGFSFDKTKWKVRGLFFMAAILMGVIVLNSLRVISGVSSSLSSMGNVALILGIVILIFMFLYIFIYYLIELFKYFKSRREMKWQINSNPV